MTQLQLILLLLAVAIFAIFFKQLFSGNYPKRGVDYEPATPNKAPAKNDSINKTLNPKTNRIEQLLQIAKTSLDKNDNLEAKKALESLLILDPNNIEAKKMLGVANLNMNYYPKAKELFLEVLEQNPNDDLVHNLLANTLHKLGEDELAIKHHKKAVELDSTYAPYYFNYANTLYDLGQFEQALNLYKKALELDPNLNEAKKIISEIENEQNK
jgi:tetratricopeptide (TPR) repeat protein